METITHLSHILDIISKRIEKFQKELESIKNSKSEGLFIQGKLNELDFLKKKISKTLLDYEE